MVVVATISPYGPAVAALPAVRYTIMELGPTGSTDSSIANAVNNAGVVVGYVQRNGGTPTAFRWADGRGVPLRGLIEGAASWANAVNDAGQVAGTAARANGYGFPMRWRSDGAITDLGGPSDNALGVGNGIDPAGRVVGGQRPSTSQGPLQGRLYERSGASVPLGTGLGVANAINIRGQVVGAPAYLWQNGAVTHLPPLVGGTVGEARAINTRGQIAGGASLISGEQRAVVWNGQSVRDLGTVNGIRYNRANGINAVGQIVGTADPMCTPCPSSRAWLWDTQGALVALDALIPQGSGWVLQQANGINDRGQIVGAGLHNGRLRAYLLTPVVHA
jgi:probable HAF family extracellular repeat protein